MAVHVCELCGRRYKRTEFLLHKTVCTGPWYYPGDSDEEQEDIQLSEVVDDCDADPHCPSEVVDDCDVDPHWQPELSEARSTPPCSPVTPDQESVAQFAEENFINIPCETWPQEVADYPFTYRPKSQCSSTVTHEQTSVAQLEENLIDMPTEVNLSDTIDVQVTATCTKDKVTPSHDKLFKKLLQLKEQANAWQEKKKSALKEGLQSKSRRMNRRIKKLKDSISELESGSLLSSTNLKEKDWIDTAEPTQLDSGSIESPVLEEAVDLHPEISKVKKMPRKKNFCLYCKNTVSKFTEHIMKAHPDTQEGKQLINITGSGRERRTKTMSITGPLIKKWNLIYNETVPSELSIPVKRRHGGKPVSSIVCKYCKGQYRRDKLSVHLKSCDSYLLQNAQDLKRHSEGRTSAIKSHSIPSIKDHIKTCVTHEFIEEILQGIFVDEVITVALNDELIMKFASEFHKSRREISSKQYVIRELRDLTKLFIKMKDLQPNLRCMRDCFNPKWFNTMIDAALSLAGYTPKTGVKIPSIAYRLCQPIKDAAKMLKKDLLSEMYVKDNQDRSKIVMIDDFLNIVQSEWKVQIGRICTKARKIARVDQEEKMALDEDIVKLASFIESQYRTVISDTNKNITKTTFDLMTHMIVTHIMLLVRRRPVDFKNAKIHHYYNIDKHDELISMAGCKEFAQEDLDTCKKFHLFYVPGKNLEIVPMVLTPLMKNVMDTLIKHRQDVGIKCDTLFILSEGKPIKPNESLKLMTKKVILKKPSHLTGNGLRHQAATFSRLHSTHPQYQDYLASMLGHTLSVHKKHYELPMSILQKLTVCPILNDIMTGKKIDQSKGNKTKPYQEKASTVSVPQEEDNEEVTVEESIDQEDDEQTEQIPEGLISKKKHNKKRWSEEEQQLVFRKFGHTILKKIVPTRAQIVTFMRENQNVLQGRTVAQVMLFVRNHVLRKQKNVTPKVKRALNEVRTRNPSSKCRTKL